ncbi:MAG: helix-turn-helix transcriptional regulator [bacterium]|nr:helix-turn-helix transcriptional regulator [bacterium]
MSKKSFLLVSLKEDESKKLAQAISNDSCRKILDYLAENDASEEDLSQKLGIPMSTVHYNLQQLLKNKLVTVEEFHYSKRGKEVNHYKLANKYIIIAPKETRGIKTKLRAILPVSFFVLAGAGFLQLFSKYFSQTKIFDVAVPKVMMGTENVAEEFAVAATERAADGAAKSVTTGAGNAVASAGEAALPEATADAAQVVASEVPNIVMETQQVAVQFEPNYALWFLVGGAFAIALVALVELTIKGKK